MHLEKLLVKSFTSNCFNAVLIPCTAPFKLIEVGTDIIITILSRLYFVVIHVQIISQIWNLTRPVVTLWAESLNSRSNSAQYVLMM